MITVLLGLLAAVTYGASDFLGGRAATRAPVIRVGVVMQATSLVLIVPVAFLVSPTPQLGAGFGSALGWGAVSGLGGALGTLALYRGLSRARIAVVAPLSGVIAAALPVAGALLTGERPSILTSVGAVIGLPAVWLIAGGGAADPAAAAVRRPSGVVDGLIAGLGFGLLFFALDRAGGDHGLWPVVTGQGSALMIMTIALAVTFGRGRTSGVRPGPAGSWWPWAAAAGVLAIVANGSFFLATTGGLLTVAAVLTSLYPAATVALARLVLDERIARRQGLGLALAAAAVVLITLG